jgi:hypothetical protein
MIMELLASQTNYVVTQSGIGLGAALAMVLSWQRNKSILLAIIHGIFSWLYVLYFALTRRENETDNSLTEELTSEIEQIIKPKK